MYPPFVPKVRRTFDLNAPANARKMVERKMKHQVVPLQIKNHQQMRQLDGKHPP